MLKRLLPKRALVALGLALSFVVSAAAPAQATYSYSVDNTVPTAQRPRTGASGWVPTTIDFKSEWASGRAWMTFGFQWLNQPHLRDTEGDHQAIELDAEVDCSWARNAFVTYGGWTQGYWGPGFDTNVPVDALPYEDTIFGEPCNANLDHSGRGHFGVGVLNAAKLHSGVHYYIRVALSRDTNVGEPTTQSTVDLRIGTGIAFDSHDDGPDPLLPPQLGNDCVFNDTEITGWNAATDAGLQQRLQGDWCSWQDWHHSVVRSDSGQVHTGSATSQYFNTDHLNNTMFDDSANGYAFGTGTNRAVYCNDTAIAYEGSCYLQVNKGTDSFASVNQTVTVPAGSTHEFMTAETAVRCRSGSSCLVGLLYYALGAQNEGREIQATVPNDGHWYILRIDSNHGQGVTGFYYDHSADTLQRWEFHSYSASNVDVDFTFLGAKTAVDAVQYGGHPTDLPNLVAADQPYCTYSIPSYSCT